MTPSDPQPPDDLESDPFSDPYADASFDPYGPYDQDGEYVGYDDPTMRPQPQFITEAP